MRIDSEDGSRCIAICEQKYPSLSDLLKVILEADEMGADSVNILPFQYSSLVNQILQFAKTAVAIVPKGKRIKWETNPLADWNPETYIPTEEDKLRETLGRPDPKPLLQTTYYDKTEEESDGKDG